jgi:hypothetical protein
MLRDLLRASIGLDPNRRNSLPLRMTGLGLEPRTHGLKDRKSRSLSPAIIMCYYFQVKGLATELELALN